MFDSFFGATNGLWGGAGRTFDILLGLHVDHSDLKAAPLEGVAQFDVGADQGRSGRSGGGHVRQLTAEGGGRSS